MAVTQYIGSRYVPVFADPIEWSNQKEYEPLTIVTHQGNSYTSKQFVPVGIDIANEDFWAITGNYNAQVEQYRREVATWEGRIDENAANITTEASARASADTNLSNRINQEANRIDQEASARASADTNLSNSINEKANKRIAVYIGNSYTNGEGSTSGDVGLRALTKHFFDETYRFTAGGAGFAAYTGHTTTFVDLLSRAVDSPDFDNEDVTDIIFISAMGDTRALCEGADSTVVANLQACSATVLAEFPNAQMYVAYAEMVYQRDTQSSYSPKYWLYQLRVHQIFYSQHALYNYSYLGWIGWNRNNTNGVNANDGYHPNDVGYRVLASAFANAWHGSSPYVNKNFSSNGINVYAQDPLIGRIYLPATLQAATFWPDGIVSGTEYKLCDIVTDNSIASVIPLQSVNSIFIPVLMSGTVHIMSVFIKFDSTTGNAALYGLFRENIPSPSNAYSGRQIWYDAQITASPNIGVA